MDDRVIILDTETTGLDKKTDRLVEIGAIEMVNLVPTGRSFHTYINPQREVGVGAFKVHGLSRDFLKGHPTFKRVGRKFIEFISGVPLVIHNANFDLGFINEELARCDQPPLENTIIDSLELAKLFKPGGYHNLDALCSFYKVDVRRVDPTGRALHGAIVDCKLLGEVYAAMMGGRQGGLDLVGGGVEKPAPDGPDYSHLVRSSLPPPVSPAELEAHRTFIAEMGEKAIWNRYECADSVPDAA